MAVSPCAPGYAPVGGVCTSLAELIPPPRVVPNPDDPNAPPIPVGNRVGNPGDIGNDDLFTNIVTGVVGLGVGAIVGGGGGAAIGQQIAQALVSGAPGALSNILNLNLPGFDLGALLANQPSYFNPGPGLIPGVDIASLSSAIAGQPFDPGGLGGGVLTSGPYLGEAGKVAGALLKGKRIDIRQLTAGREGVDVLLRRLLG